MAKSYEKWKVYGNVFDQYTIRLLFRLSSQGHFLDLQSPVAIGKEANVFTAKQSDNTFVIIKIYRLESCNFNKMYNYIKSDQRFEKLKRQRRKVVFAWVYREFQNLMRAREAGVRVPTPLAVKDHIIVEEMIGDKSPAPKLKDTRIGADDMRILADKIMDDMKKFYASGLVHGDLSEYNILIHNNSPFFIDLSQGTTSRDPNYKEYWERDIKNMAKYFAKKGLKIDNADIKKRIGYNL